MSEYDQSFCVIGSVGRFPHARDGYLPPLVPPERELVDDPDILWEMPGQRAVRKSSANLEREIAQLKGQVLYLLGKDQQRKPRDNKL